MMNIESSLVDAGLRNWTTTLNRASRFFEGLTEEQLRREVAAGKNRLIYLWGHVAAVNDALLPLLGLGERLHPELDSTFLSNPDRTLPDRFSGEDLKRAWGEINAALEAGFSRLSPAEWLQKHNSVSEEDFAKEPHRTRFTILLGRSSHVAYHLGQAMLVTRE